MICPKCQKEIADGSNYCYFCGERTARVSPPPPPPGWTAAQAGPRRLVCSVTDRKLGGVCAGLGEYLGMDVAIVRVLAVLSVIFYGIGLFAYLVAWLVIPEGDAMGAPPEPPSRRQIGRASCR